MTYFVHYIVGDDSTTIYKGESREEAVKVAEAKFEEIKANKNASGIITLSTPTTKWGQLGWSQEQAWYVKD